MIFIWVTRRINEPKRAHLLFLLVSPHSSSPLLYILRLPKLLQKCSPNLTVSDILGRGAEQNPRPSSCLMGCIIGNSEEHGIQSLAGFPFFFFFFMTAYHVYAL